MKKMICILVITLLTVGAGVAESVVSANLYRELNAELVDLRASIIAHEGELDNAETLEKIDAVLARWERSRDYVLLSSNHTVARSLDEKLVSLRSWLQCNGYEDARMLCDLSVMLTEDLIDETYPIISNLF